MNNPMNIVYDYQGIAIYLKKKINEGGEGEIWETSVDGQLAKIYLEKNRSTEMYAKIKFMIEHPPVNPTKHQGHNCFTWPTRLVRDDKQKFLGFLMPKIESAKELINLYSPQLRNSLLPEFNWKYLLTAAKNLAWIIYHIHERGYILGDIQPKNILVNNQALITIVDTDSFQVIDKRNNKTYPCPVSLPGFTPPELIGKTIREVTQEEYHDNFRLGVIIYLLVFSGLHPFQGKLSGQGQENNPLLDTNIKNGWWPFGIDNIIQPTKTTIPLDILHPDLKKCFLKCFNEGHSTPSKRPSAKDWYLALDTAINDLMSCQIKPEYHIYSRTYNLSQGGCYWCHRAENLGADIFEAKISQSSNTQTTIQEKQSNTQTKQSYAQSTTSKQSKSTNSPNRKLLFIIVIIVIIIIVVIALALG